VDGACNQFLSRTGFPQNQHRRRGGSNRFNLSQNPLEGRTSANNLLKIVTSVEKVLESIHF
jgi:hypothetical protein